MKRSLTMLAALVFTVCAAGSRPAMAGASFDFLFSMNNVHDDNQLFLNLAVTDSGLPRDAVEPILPRLRYVEADLPVVLFLSRQSGRPPIQIVELRSRGLSWPAIFPRVGVPYAVLFRGIDRDPGPPYGSAWGYWKKNPRGVRFSDADITGLVQVQVGHRVGGIAPFELARARGQGKSVIGCIADRKGRPFKNKFRAKPAPGGAAQGPGRNGAAHGPEIQRPGKSHGPAGRGGEGSKSRQSSKDHDHGKDH